jgi:hypothetical protein
MLLLFSYTSVIREVIIYYLLFNRQPSFSSMNQHYEIERYIAHR